MQNLNDPNDAPSVTVFSCTPEGWLTSSHKMGEDMAAAVGDGACYTVVTPTDCASFTEAWKNAGEVVVIHTHGSPSCLSNAEKCRGKAVIVTSDEVDAMEANPAVRLVMMTACQTGGGKPKKNIAARLSRKIAPDGLLIANKYTVWGASTEFGSKEADGWVLYRAGEVLPLPRLLTMGDARALLSMFDRDRKKP